LRIRRATYADVPGIMNLERESATAAHWSPQQYENLFLTNDEHYSAYFVWIAEDEFKSQPEKAMPSLIAFLVVHRVNDEWELQNIVVSEAVRRTGLGSKLLHEVITLAQAERASAIFLEVRQSNKGARGLYRELGFEEAGIRKAYYANPTEDAIIYRRNLSEQRCA
jgi:ribosomal-protein-alanine N-acetyltransferase